MTMKQSIDLNVLATRYVNPMASQQRKLDDALAALSHCDHEQAASALTALALDIAYFGACDILSFTLSADDEAFRDD